MADQLYIAPAGASQSRTRVLPGPSENVSHLLKPIDGGPPRQPKAEYLPVDEVEWVIEVTWKNESPRNARDVAKLFRNTPWNTLGTKTEFGKNFATGRWTYLVSGNGPTDVKALRIAWPYFADWDSAAPEPTPDLFTKRLEAVRSAVAGWEGVVVKSEIPVPAAAARAVDLRALHQRFSSEIVLRIKAPFLRKYDGRSIWDVLLCLGLEWGDMDCFHWRNDSGVGADHHFSVWTSTPPGYFLPEQIAAKKLKAADLIFGFSIPRSINPAAVLDRMYAAAKYSQSRLGGRMVDASDEAFDLNASIEKIRIAANELTSRGFPPGSPAAMRFF